MLDAGVTASNYIFDYMFYYVFSKQETTWCVYLGE